MNNRFYNPTEICWASWKEVGELLPPPPLKVLVAVSCSSQTRAEKLNSQLLPGYDVEILSGIPADPTDVTVQHVLERVRTSAPDWIIAMGGGSVLDSAKAAAVLARNRQDVLAYLQGQVQIECPGIPMIAVPTTAGSGSEVTPFSSITDSQGKRKISISHEYLYPKYALIDSSLTVSLSARQMAISGMDALSHAIESYWSNCSTSVTDAYALVAAKQMMSALPEVSKNGEQLKARHAAMEGSVLAGLAISNAKSTAVHAISYPMTVFYHVPHGLACSMLLPHMIRYNAGSMPDHKEQTLLERFGLESMDHLADQIGHLQHQLGLPVKLGELGLGKADIPTIVENGFRPDRMNNNPRNVTAATLTHMLEGIL